MTKSLFFSLHTHKHTHTHAYISSCFTNRHLRLQTENRTKSIIVCTIVVKSTQLQTTALVLATMQNRNMTFSHVKGTGLYVIPKKRGLHSTDHKDAPNDHFGLLCSLNRHVRPYHKHTVCSPIVSMYRLIYQSLCSLRGGLNKQDLECVQQSIPSDVVHVYTRVYTKWNFRLSQPLLKGYYKLREMRW